MLGTAQRSVTRPLGGSEDGAREAADRQVADLIRSRGWRVKDGAPARRTLVEVLATAQSLGHPDVADLLEPYADAAERLAVPEVEWVARGQDPDSLAERAVVGTVFGDAMVTALRRLAQAQESARRFAAAEDGPDR